MASVSKAPSVKLAGTGKIRQIRERVPHKGFEYSLQFHQCKIFLLIAREYIEHAVHCLGKRLIWGIYVLDNSFKTFNLNASIERFIGVIPAKFI